MHSELLLIKGKDGTIRRLHRRSETPGQVGEENHTWKWLFAELKDDEDIHTIIQEKTRWGEGGTFGLSDHSQGTADLDDPSLPTMFEIS